VKYKFRSTPNMLVNGKYLKSLCDAVTHPQEMLEKFVNFLSEIKIRSRNGEGHPYQLLRSPVDKVLIDIRRRSTQHLGVHRSNREPKKDTP